MKKCSSFPNRAVTPVLIWSITELSRIL